MRAVITVIGKDKVGIIASLSAICQKYNINIIDITQKVLSDIFTMIMIVSIDDNKDDFKNLVDAMDKASDELELEIHVMHEDIFNSMHKI